MFKRIREAEVIVGGRLSKPSKMPGYAYGIPAKRCAIGSILRKISGSVCSNCYALKGRYVFANVQTAQERRFQSLRNAEWVAAMVFLITRRKVKWFRWHDSGDIQGIWHLAKICEVAVQCPDTDFWLPTREFGIVKHFKLQGGVVPDNLVIRLSAQMIDGKPPSDMFNTSTVVSDKGTASCPARFQNGKCGPCRKCWDKEVANVSYPEH